MKIICCDKCGLPITEGMKVAVYGETEIIDQDGNFDLFELADNCKVVHEKCKEPLGRTNAVKAHRAVIQDYVKMVEAIGDKTSVSEVQQFIVQHKPETPEDFITKWVTER